MTTGSAARVTITEDDPVTEDMIEEEHLTCEEPTRILLRRPRKASRRGAACLAGNFTVCFDTFAGEIRLPTP